MYKLYCSIINERLTKWVERHGNIVDEQNGFRKARSTVDHLVSLTNIIDTRKKARLSTFCAFIDFKKAYDFVSRNILWQQLMSIGVNGRIFKAVTSLYSSVSACVRVNGHLTDWFEVGAGLRQGCPLSPLLFNLFINDLALKLKAVGKGITIGNENVCTLLYADDIVLVAETEEDLQSMLNILNEWCGEKKMVVNCAKSQIVHFRTPSTHRTGFIFTCGNSQLNIVDGYTYLGLYLSEFLDYNITAKRISQSASRALGLLIAKVKCNGDLPYDVFSKLFDTMVWPVIAYGAAVWGDKSFACINAVQNRAMRFYMGLGKYTPNAAVQGDMGWLPPIVKQWKAIGQQWFRYRLMEDGRINKGIWKWCNDRASAKCKNWCYIVKTKFNELDLLESNNHVKHPKGIFLQNLVNCLFTVYIDEWTQSVSKDTGTRGRGKNKLRTYRSFKTEFGTEFYLRCSLPKKHRSAFAKFRCGVAPLKIETGRYENRPLEDRICPFGCNVVEDETHVMVICPQYNSVRNELFQKASSLYENFINMPDQRKCSVLFSAKDLVRVCAKTCFLILQLRNNLLYK